MGGQVSHKLNLAFTVVLPEALPPHARINSNTRLPEEHRTLVSVTDHSAKNSFAFTPFSLFNKAQATLLHGSGSRAFFRQARLDLSRSYPLDGVVTPGTEHTAAFRSIPEEGSDEEVKEKSSPLFDSRAWINTLTKMGRSPTSPDPEKQAVKESSSNESISKTLTPEVAKPAPAQPESIGLIAMGLGLRGQMERAKAAAAAARPKTAPVSPPNTPNSLMSFSGSIRRGGPPAYSPPRKERSFGNLSGEAGGRRPGTAESLVVAPPPAARRKSSSTRPHTADAALLPSVMIWNTQSEHERVENEAKAQASRDARRLADGYWQRMANEMAEGHFREEVSCGNLVLLSS